MRIIYPPHGVILRTEKKNDNKRQYLIEHFPCARIWVHIFSTRHLINANTSLPASYPHCENCDALDCPVPPTWVNRHLSPRALLQRTQFWVHRTLVSWDNLSENNSSVFKIVPFLPLTLIYCSKPNNVSHPQVFLSLMQRKEGRKYTRYSLQFCPSPLNVSGHVWIPGWTVSSWNVLTFSPTTTLAATTVHITFQKWRVGLLISLHILLWYSCHLLGTKGSLNPGAPFFPCGQESKKNIREPRQKTKSCCLLQCGPR